MKNINVIGVSDEVAERVLVACTQLAICDESELLDEVLDYQDLMLMPLKDLVAVHAQMSLCQIVHPVSTHDKSGIDIMLQAERLKSYLAGILQARYSILAAGVEKAVTMV
jgi:hypothetical protein